MAEYALQWPDTERSNYLCSSSTQQEINHFDSGVLMYSSMHLIYYDNDLSINSTHVTPTIPTTSTHHHVFGLSYSPRIVLPHTSNMFIFNSFPHSPPSPHPTPNPSPLLHPHAVNHLPSHPKSTHHTVTTPCVYLLVKTTTAKTTNSLTAPLACIRALPDIKSRYTWSLSSVCPVFQKHRTLYLTKGKSTLNQLCVGWNYPSARVYQPLSKAKHQLWPSWLKPLCLKVSKSLFSAHTFAEIFRYFPLRLWAIFTILCLCWKTARSRSQLVAYGLLFRTPWCHFSRHWVAV